ncbi:MAG TPA: hypothetical protein VLV86_16560 [Vicinamibacterales bacterium]|nr:hypothetical protein [Vicinamibacterales bacterium]
MRSVLAFLLIAACSIECARLSAAQCPDNHPAVTVQIHDYAHLKSDSLSKAEDIVTRTYKRVGVGIEWLGVLQQDGSRAHRGPGGEEARTPIAQLTINILTPAMAKRGGVADDVLGFVAVPPEGGMGRIGYVVYERVRDVASGGPASESDILGVVVAHDIGRLILGAGSGTHNGIMNRNWDRRDLEKVDPLTLEFTLPEIDRLRAALEQNSAPSFAGATACISNGDEAGQ